MWMRISYAMYIRDLSLHKILDYLLIIVVNLKNKKRAFCCSRVVKTSKNIVVQCGLRDQLDVTLVIYLYLLYSLLNMFRATLCPSSGVDDLVVLFRCVAEPWLCRQSDSVGCLSVHWEALSTCAKCFPMDTRWPETCWANYKGDINISLKWHLVGLLIHIILKTIWY